jgi:asparagine synthase (glutamine-hydrolysing)
MKLQFQFSTPSVFPWSVEGNSRFRGFVYDPMGNRLEDISALEFIRNDIRKNYPRYPLKWNGHFSAVIELEDECWVISDQIGAFPIFYGNEGNNWMIADDARSIANTHSKELKKDSLHFELFSICPGNETCFEGVEQLLAGEVLVLNNGAFQLMEQGTIAEGTNAQHMDLTQVWNGVVDRLLSSGSPRKWIVPLSAGWDSRLILCSLIERGVKNIVTYTYGTSDSFEVKCAQRVARTLNVEWHFVEYNEETLRSFWSDEIQQFFHFESRGSLAVQEQELFAVMHLKSLGIVHSEDIVIPGYCGDLLAGSYTIPEFRNDSAFNREIAEQWIHAKHLSFIGNHEVYDRARDIIFSQLFSQSFETMGDWNAFYEKWFTQQKVSKYILSGLRSFEKVGIEWRMPYWDREWMDLWYSQPLQERWHRAKFKKWAMSRYFSPMQISLELQLGQDYKVNRLKEKLRSRFPRFYYRVKSMFQWKDAQDINNSAYLKKSISSFLVQQGVPPRINELNPLIAQLTRLRMMRGKG